MIEVSVRNSSSWEEVSGGWRRRLLAYLLCGWYGGTGWSWLRFVLPSLLRGTEAMVRVRGADDDACWLVNLRIEWVP